MKQTHLKHFALATVSSFALFLAACGGGSGTTNVAPTLAVVAFGDSLTDGGSYKDGILGVGANGLITISNAYGGGKFTTNGPNAKTWAEIVAEGLNTSATFGPAAAEGFSQGYTKQANMLNFAQGGSKVTVTNANAATAASEISVTTQLDRYLNGDSTYGTTPSTGYGTFNSRQLVLVNAGANDIFQAGGNPALVTAAAQELAVQVKLMQTKGAERIVVASLPDMGKTPYALSGGPANAQGATQLAALYNSTLKSALDAQGVKYVWLDVFTWFVGVLTNPAANGLTNTTGTACNLAILPAPSSLFCSQATLVSAGADMTYAFADGVHPSTKMHQLFGAFALTAIRAQGW
jgi:phospholipase/lecithinase/hemolysin